MTHTQANGYTLESLAEAEEGAVWYDEKQGMIAVQWGTIIRYMEPGEFRSYAALLSRASAQSLPGHMPAGGGVIVPLPLRGGR